MSGELLAIRGADPNSPIPNSADPHTLAQRAEGGLVILWTGSPPPQRPDHPGLSPVLDRGLLDGLSAWLESRPPGPTLDQMAPQLHPADLAQVLIDVDRALAALHQAGLHHGALSASEVVVGPKGQPVLLGAGRFQAGSKGRDLQALTRLLRETWPAAHPSPKLSRQSSLGRALADWLGTEYPAADRTRLAELSQSWTPGPLGEPLPWQSTGFDEVGLDLGPDHPSSGGLLDFWSTGRSRSGAHTAAVEGTLSERDLREVPGRGALLARLLAPPRSTLDPERFGDKQGQPLQALKAVLAEEPLDPVPACEGPRMGTLLPPVHTEAPQRDRTSLASRMPIREEVSGRMLVLFGGVALALAMGALALVIALLN